MKLNLFLCLIASCSAAFSLSDPSLIKLAKEIDNLKRLKYVTRFAFPVDTKLLETTSPDAINRIYKIVHSEHVALTSRRADPMSYKSDFANMIRGVLFFLEQQKREGGA